MARTYEQTTIRDILDSPIKGWSKSAILDNGLTVREYNGHARVSKSASAVAYFVGVLSASLAKLDGADPDCVCPETYETDKGRTMANKCGACAGEACACVLHPADALAQAIYSLAEDEDSADFASWEAKRATPAKRAITMAKERASNSRPADAGAGEGHASDSASHARPVAGQARQRQGVGLSRRLSAGSWRAGHSGHG